MARSFKIGFVSDPIENYNPDAETTLFLMREAAKRGAMIYQWEPDKIFLEKDRLWANVRKLQFTPTLTLPHLRQRRISLWLKGGGNCLRGNDILLLPLDSFDMIFLRKDPPFDLAYLHHLYLMMRLEGKVLMLNRPSGILQANEKLLALDFPFHPPTCVASDLETLRRFAQKAPHGVVLKPLGMAGGVGIIHLKKGARLQKLPHTPTLCQHYIREIQKCGDKRILLFNGKILGAFARFPKKGEFRANLHQGGRFVRAQVTAHDKKIVRTVAPALKKLGLYFVGLDIIGPYLTEINVTSPMGIREINDTQGIRCEEKIFDQLCHLNV